MRMCSMVARSVVVALLLAAPALGAPPERTLPFDPVELVTGREVAGKTELALERDGIGYRFTTPENKAAFEKEPKRFEVADGGACGSMGPMSGVGDARRFAVREGRIYFFASDGCRKNFLKDPAKCIETDAAPPKGTAEQLAQGKVTMDRLVVWAGGAERVKGITAFRAAVTTTELSGGKEWEVTKETAVRFPGCYFQKEAWNDSWFSNVRTPEGAAAATSRGVTPVAEGQRRAFDRWMARWPVVLVKAHVDGGSLTAVGDGEGTVAGVPVEFVKIGLSGATSRLAVEKGTGRLVQLGFRGRDNTGFVGDSVRTFTRYATVGGVTLPAAYIVNHNGKEAAKAGLAFDTFEVNPELPAGLFDVKP